MPMDENNELVHGVAKASDPAHDDCENTDHATTSGEKPTTVVEAITDASFFPTLEKAGPAQKLKSTLFLIFLVFGAVSGLWLLGFELFQTAPRDVPIPLAMPGGDDEHMKTFGDMAKEVGIMTGGVSTAILALLYSTGTMNIDFWSLVIEYGWWTLPAVGAAGLLFVMMQEDSLSMNEVS